jgi:hypothetical protein
MFMDGENKHAKMTKFPKSMYNFNKIPFKIPMTFLTEIKNRILKFV